MKGNGPDGASKPNAAWAPAMNGQRSLHKAVYEELASCAYNPARI